MEGSCNCGSIHFNSSDNITAIVNCHCQLCRKMNGSAFSKYVVVQNDDFVLKTGTLKKMRLSTRATKSFCQDCGTPIYNQSIKFTGLKILYLGSLCSGRLNPNTVLSGSITLNNEVFNKKTKTVIQSGI